ncbi:MAG TPA: RNA polymerase sigma factor [Anaeromyxobacter sp.]
MEAELERLHPHSFGWALACCRRDRQEAEEVLQATYLKVIEGNARFDGRSSLKTWLFGVIRRTASEHRRRVWMRQLLSGVLARQPRPPACETPEASLGASEGHAHVSAGLASLSPRQREALELVFYHDLSIAEAAVVMGVSVGSARQHYERGKRNMREALLARGATP